MDILYRCLEYPKYVPPDICRSEWVKRNATKVLGKMIKKREVPPEF